MPITTEYIAETIELGELSSIIDNALRSLHITGSVLLRESYASHWSIAIPDAQTLSSMLKAEPNVSVVAFHLVEFGHCTLQSDTGDNIVIKAGEMVICFGGESHQLIRGKPDQAQAIETLLVGGPNIQRPNIDIGTEGASLLCGVFLLQHTMLNPLFNALPSVMHSKLTRSGELHNLSGVSRLMAEEIDREPRVSSYVVERLLEVLCAEAVRAHIELMPHHETNWLSGIKDPVINKVIAAIHSQPGDDWSVRRMAADVAMSPSRFAARFSESVGDSPMAYAAKWRMNLACRALINSKDSINKIANDVGYENQTAFSRAFKKHVGASPAHWRNQQRQQPG